MQWLRSSITSYLRASIVMIPERTPEMKDFLQQQRDIFWHFNKEKLHGLSDDVIVEYVLNYGDYDGKHMYSGRYTNSSDILYTFDGRHVYKGRYTDSSNIVYTFDGKHIYSGRYADSSNILRTFDGSLPMPVWMAVM